jgi:hypothetical protein
MRQQTDEAFMKSVVDEKTEVERKAWFEERQKWITEANAGITQMSKELHEIENEIMDRGVVEK